MVFVVDDVVGSPISEEIIIGFMVTKLNEVSSSSSERCNSFPRSLVTINDGNGGDGGGAGAMREVLKAVFLPGGDSSIPTPSTP